MTTLPAMDRHGNAQMNERPFLLRRTMQRRSHGSNIKQSFD